MIQNDATTRADNQHSDFNTKLEYTPRLNMYSLPVHQSQNPSAKSCSMEISLNHKERPDITKPHANVLISIFNNCNT